MKQRVACIDLWPRLFRQGFATLRAFENCVSEVVELAQKEKKSWAILAKTGKRLQPEHRAQAVPFHMQNTAQLQF